MKTNKRLLALLTSGLLAVVPVAATGLTAFAAGTSTLTITDTDTASHTYNAYQIIKGTKADGKLTELTFGDGVNSATLISTLNTNAAALGINTIASNATAQYVAEELSKITDADKIEKLAKLFNTSGVLTTTKTALTKSTNTYSASTFPTTYSGLAKLGNFSGSSSILSSNFLSQVKVWRLSKPVPAAIVVSVTIVPVKRQIIYSLIPIHFCTCAKSLGFSSLIHSNLYTGAIG